MRWPFHENSQLKVAGIRSSLKVLAIMAITSWGTTRTRGGPAIAEPPLVFDRDHADLLVESWNKRHRPYRR
jgi:hypothetical protein